jgi:hypothetical protein
VRRGSFDHPRDRDVPGDVVLGGGSDLRHDSAAPHCGSHPLIAMESPGYGEVCMCVCIAAIAITMQCDGSDHAARVLASSMHARMRVEHMNAP